MRYACAVLAVVLAMPLAGDDVAAQTVAGVRLGASVANVTGGELGLPDFRTAPMIVGSLRQHLSDLVALQIEAGYVPKGFKDSGGGTELVVKLNYVEVPVLLQFVIRPDEDQAAVISIGGLVGFEAGCSMAVESQGVSASVDCQALNTGQDIARVVTESTDLGIVFGAGFEAQTSRALIVFDFRMGISIRDSVTIIDVQDQFDGNASGGNINIALTAGVGFPLGG